MQSKNVKYYSKLISKKYKIPQKIVHFVLMYFMKNVIRTIKNGNDIRIPKFGHIYFDKKALINYHKKNVSK